MREINETVYKLMNTAVPDMDMNVSQFITDDILEKQKSGELNAEVGASEVLDKKAHEIHGEKTGAKKVRTTKASGGTGVRKVKKKVTKKKKKVVKKQAPPKKSNNLYGILAAVSVIAAAAAYYFELI